MSHVDKHLVIFIVQGMLQYNLKVSPVLCDAQVKLHTYLSVDALELNTDTFFVCRPDTVSAPMYSLSLSSSSSSPKSENIFVWFHLLAL